MNIYNVNSRPTALSQFPFEGNLYAAEFSNGLTKVGCGAAGNRLYYICRQAFDKHDFSLLRVATWKPKNHHAAERELHKRIADRHRPLTPAFQGSHEFYQIGIDELTGIVDADVLSASNPVMPASQKQEYWPGCSDNMNSFVALPVKQNGYSRVVIEPLQKPMIDFINHKELSINMRIKSIRDGCMIEKAGRLRPKNDLFSIYFDWFAFRGNNPFPNTLLRGSQEWCDYKDSLQEIEKAITKACKAYFLRRRQVMKLYDTEFTLRDLAEELALDGAKGKITNPVDTKYHPDLDELYKIFNARQKA